MKYSIIYSEISKEQVRGLHPQIKPSVKSALELIKNNPYIGKNLQSELSGYISFRVKRFRIIYRINEDEKMIEVYHIDIQAFNLWLEQIHNVDFLYDEDVIERKVAFQELETGPSLDLKEAMKAWSQVSEVNNPSAEDRGACGEARKPG
ncbi:MAG: type II toxin-antitoxin system RelE/ParE family toxin [Desulfamplus sp.]|nr:type II toxin-antitoxin system RelE/ParE family toxin [Desulfamplus sp.]